MVEIEITEPVARIVAERFDEHNPGVTVLDYEQVDGEWELYCDVPTWVEMDPLGAPTPKSPRRDRISVRELLNQSSCEELIFEEAYGDDLPEYRKS